MYVAKDLHNTVAYYQLRNAVNVCIPNVASRPNALGRLVRMVLNNINTNNKEMADAAFEENGLDVNLDKLMVWRDTKEGHGYWNAINGGRLHNIAFNLFPKKGVQPPIHDPRPIIDDDWEPVPNPKPAPNLQDKKPEQKKRATWWGAQ